MTVAQAVDDLVEVAAVGAWRAARHLHFADQPAVAGGVAGTLGAEHAAADADDFLLALAVGEVDGMRQGVLGLLAVLALLVGLVGLFGRCHRKRPLSSMVGVTASAAFSASRTASSRLTPSGISWILSCSFRIACSSISGRGGHPGR